MAEKQKLQSIEINIFIPKDPSMLAEENFKVQDILEDDPDMMERMQYHVSKVKKFCLIIKLHALKQHMLKVWPHAIFPSIKELFIWIIILSNIYKYTDLFC